jgi:hypothetical protein
MSKCFCHLNGYEVKDAKARKEIENVKSNIRQLSDITKKRFVCFGDSYLKGYTIGHVYYPTQSWGYKLQHRLGISDENFIMEGTTGGSFALEGGVHWQDQIDTLVVSNPETIDYIVLVGGTNDYESTRENLLNAVSLFASKCRAKFPNAVIVMGCIVGHVRHWGLDKGFTTINNYKTACMQNGIAFMGGLENTVRHLAYYQTDYLHVNETCQEIICDGIENFLLGGCIDTKIVGLAEFSAPTGTTHTFSQNNMITGINNDTAFLKNNLRTIVTLNGSTVKFDGSMFPIATVEKCDIIGRDDSPFQYPIQVTIQTGGTNPAFMVVSGELIIRDFNLYLSLYKLKADGSNWEDSIQPTAIILPPFYIEHTLCMNM